MAELYDALTRLLEQPSPRNIEEALKMFGDTRALQIRGVALELQAESIEPIQYRSVARAVQRVITQASERRVTGPTVGRILEAGRRRAGVSGVDRAAEVIRDGAHLRIRAAFIFESPAVPVERVQTMPARGWVEITGKQMAPIVNSWLRSEVDEAEDRLLRRFFTNYWDVGIADKITRIEWAEFKEVDE